MAESLNLTKSKDRISTYEALLPQLDGVLSGETDLIANLANTTAALKQAFDFLWIGFYLVKGNELVLGPFQGPLACTRIAFHRGVCGHAYTTQKPIVVANVNEFPGHIACSSLAQSEVVIPIFSKNKKVVGVLDVDSIHLNDFSEVDVVELEKVVRLLERLHFRA